LTKKQHQLCHHVGNAMDERKKTINWNVWFWNTRAEWPERSGEMKSRSVAIRLIRITKCAITFSIKHFNIVRCIQLYWNFNRSFQTGNFQTQRRQVVGRVGRGGGGKIRVSRTARVRLMLIWNRWTVWRY
jgi:hypothetical protein